MAVDLKSRKVMQFRCYYSPEIGPMPKNAFNRNDFPVADFELTPAGVYVWLKTKPGPNIVAVEQEYIVPYANIQAIKLMTPADEEKFYPKSTPSDKK